MDKGPDQDTRDDPDGLVEAIAENDSDDLYAPPEQVPEKTVRRPVDERPDNSPDDLDLDSLDDAVETVRSLLADRYDDVSDIIRPPLIDAVPGDDLKHGSEYDFTPMVCAWIYRLIAPSDGYSVVSWEDLADRLDTNDELAANLGFDGETPSEKTLREQWQIRIRPGFRDHVRYMAAECAVKAEEYELETAEDIRENLIAEHRPEEPDVDPIGEMEQETKEDAYSIQADIIRDVCSYDRDDSSEWESHLFTDAAAHMCRRNEYAEQGIERMGKDYGLIEEHEDGSEEWNVFTQQTFRRTVRNVERTKIEGYYDDDDDAYGARWVAPHDLVDPNLVRGDLRDALEDSWTIDPHNPDGETATWHLRTEEAIERQIEWLRDEQDVIDEDDTFNLRIDYTTHNYSKHSSTDSDAPVGVHKQTHLETGYAWKELQGTIKINGRAFIIASLSYTPQNDQFQGVRYILDRARELVNIDTVMADAEFVDTKICRYIRQVGCDYAIRKGATDTVKDTVEGFEGRADWDSNWTLMSSGRRKTHNTTLVGLEKDFKSVPDHKKKDGEEDEPDTTLDDFGDEEDDGLDDQQLTLKQVAEESHQDEEEIDYFCIITSKSVDRAGIDPDENPIGHDPEGSAWGIGRLYRDRWGVETAFRDKKGTFAAKTRSRDLGYRRFLWMMENLLYNGWVMLNTAVADQSPDRDDDEIVVKQATYLDELDRRVLSGLSLDLEFPDVEFG